MPTWVKSALDQWLQSANIMSGKLFRRVQKIKKAWGDGLTEKAVWHVVREYAAKACIDKLAPHDLRSYAESWTMSSLKVVSALVKLKPEKGSA